jgi:hypothetical protein
MYHGRRDADAEMGRPELMRLKMSVLRKKAEASGADPGEVLEVEVRPHCSDGGGGGGGRRRRRRGPASQHD